MTWKIASEEQDVNMADIESPPLKIKTFQEAIQSLENVRVLEMLLMMLLV